MNDDQLDDDIGNLDIEWLKDFETIDNEYKDYYTENLSFICCNLIYINNTNEIEKIKKEKFLLKTPGIMQKEELLTIIKRNLLLDGGPKKYKLLSILKFNVNFEPMHLKTFLKSQKPRPKTHNDNDSLTSPYLQIIKNIDNIAFEKSISLFHDINELIIIFNEKNQNTLALNHTKKLISNTNKKTKRKQFKEISPL